MGGGGFSAPPTAERIRLALQHPSMASGPVRATWSQPWALGCARAWDLWQHKLGVLPSPLRRHVPAPPSPPPVHQRRRAALQGILWINNLRPEPIADWVAVWRCTAPTAPFGMCPCPCRVCCCALCATACLHRACVCVYSHSFFAHAHCVPMPILRLHLRLCHLCAKTRRTLSNARYLYAVYTIFRSCDHNALYTIFHSCESTMHSILYSALALYTMPAQDAMCAVHCCVSHILSLHFTVLLLVSNRQPASIDTSLQGPKDKIQRPRRTVD
jgi:hypothetical protein